MTYRIQTASGSWVTAERVTEVIRRGMPSPALEAWKLRTLAEYVMANPPLVPTTEGVLSAWRSDNARHARRGTAVHKAIAAGLRGNPAEVHDLCEAMPPEHMTYLAAYASWASDQSAELIGSLSYVEQTMLSGDGRVAGTADVIFGKVLVDWKTSDKAGEAWPDQVAQLGAYSCMSRLVTDKKVSGKAPQITEARIVRLVADGSYTETVLTGTDLSEARKLWHHVRAVADAVKGDR